MKPARGFDEVMIVNPYDPAREGEGARLMQFHEVGWPGFGQYADPYGYYADPYGYAGCGYADPYAYAGPYGYGDPYGAYADPYGYQGYGYGDPYGYYAEPYGYYAQPEEFDGYAQDEPVGYYAEDDPFNGYGAEPEEAVAGYAYADPYGYAAEEPMDGYAAEGDEFGDYSGYVRGGRTRFNAGCPMPTGVAGLGEEPFDGYTPPAAVNAACGDFRPGPAPPAEMPDTFRPHW